jgi:hypothetical protein
MTLERILQNSNQTIGQPFHEDGVIVDPGTVTVTITREDGTVIAADQATSGSGAAVRSVNLTAATHTGLLDRLRLDWDSATKGTLTSYVEVVGGFLFSLAQLTALKPSAQTWTAEQMADTRTLVETALERACSRAFVPRYTRETLSGTGTTDLNLSWPDLRAIRDVTVTTAGVATAYTEAQLALLAVNPSGLAYNTSYWTAGTANVTVGYEHGLTSPPPEVTRAALILARSWLGNQNRPIDDRAITFNATEGGTYSLAVPGRNGSHFGMPDVDSVVDRWNMAVGVA